MSDPSTSSPNNVRWWPTVNVKNPEQVGSEVTVATVNYNTRGLVAFLLWSLYAFIPQDVRRVIVVDIGSTDGSAEFLRVCADADICELISNDRNRYHGPALNQAVSHLADTYDDGRDPPCWVWLLDSDCVVNHPDVIRAALSVAHSSGAALLGESRWDVWHGEERLATFSLLFDPVTVWRPPTEPFVEDGDPARAFELSCRGRPDLQLASFPFSADGYVIHRGRGTLARVRETSEESNRYHAWALGHHEPHYERAHRADRRYRQLYDEFVAVTGGGMDVGRFVAEVTRSRSSR